MCSTKIFRRIWDIYNSQHTSDFIYFLFGHGLSLWEEDYVDGTNAYVVFLYESATIRLTNRMSEESESVCLQRLHPLGENL